MENYSVRYASDFGSPEGSRLQPFSKDSVTVKVLVLRTTLRANS